MILLSHAISIGFGSKAGLDSQFWSFVNSSTFVVSNGSWPWFDMFDRLHPPLGTSFVPPHWPQWDCWVRSLRSLVQLLCDTQMLEEEVLEFQCACLLGIWKMPGIWTQRSVENGGWQTCDSRHLALHTEGQHLSPGKDNKDQQGSVRIIWFRIQKWRPQFLKMSLSKSQIFLGQFPGFHHVFFCTKEMTSLNKGLFTKLDKADYICRETCDIYKEDAEGQRSYYPEFTGRTVYRAGGVEESWAILGYAEAIDEPTLGMGQTHVTSICCHLGRMHVHKYPGFLM